MTQRPDGRAFEIGDVAALPVAQVVSIAIDAEMARRHVGSLCGFVSGLRRRHEGAICAPVVMITVMGDVTDGLTAVLAATGAYVLAGTAGVIADHLHHFPFRATITPHFGRLICVDLIDHLSAWGPGRVATLRNFPDVDTAETVLRRADESALMWHWHLRPKDWTRANSLRLAAIAQDMAAPGVVTTAERLDGLSGTVDLVCRPIR